MRVKAPNKNKCRTICEDERACVAYTFKKGCFLRLGKKKLKGKKVKGKGGKEMCFPKRAAAFKRGLIYQPIKKTPRQCSGEQMKETLIMEPKGKKLTANACRVQCTANNKCCAIATAKKGKGACHWFSCASPLSKQGKKMGKGLVCLAIAKSKRRKFKKSPTKKVQKAAAEAKKEEAKKEEASPEGAIVKTTAPAAGEAAAAAAPAAGEDAAATTPAAAAVAGFTTFEKMACATVPIKTTRDAPDACAAACTADATCAAFTHDGEKCDHYRECLRQENEKVTAYLKTDRLRIGPACAAENEKCACPVGSLVHYGVVDPATGGLDPAKGHATVASLTGEVECKIASFGHDPAVGQPKQCWCAPPPIAPEGYTPAFDMDCPGNDIGKHETSGPEDCARRCGATKDCVAFALDSRPNVGKNRCWLKRRCVNIRKNVGLRLYTHIARFPSQFGGFGAYANRKACHGHDVRGAHVTASAGKPAAVAECMEICARTKGCHAVQIQREDDARRKNRRVCWFKGPKCASPANWKPDNNQEMYAANHKPMPDERAVAAAAAARANVAAARPTPLGCFKDASSRAMNNNHTGTKSDMTIEKCVEHCREKGRRYAAVQNMNDCFCESEYGRFAKHGGRVPMTDCEQACTGNPAEFCGGPYRNQVYFSGEPPFSTKDPADVPPNTLKRNAFLGCFNDRSAAGSDNSKRTMPHMVGASGYTPSKCIAACRERGHKFAGVQAGGQCFCGNRADDGGDNGYASMGRVGDSSCNTACATSVSAPYGGTASYQCGGSWKNSVFRTGVGAVVHVTSRQGHIYRCADAACTKLEEGSKPVHGGWVNKPWAYRAKHVALSEDGRAYVAMHDNKLWAAEAATATGAPPTVKGTAQTATGWTHIGNDKYHVAVSRKRVYARQSAGGTKNEMYQCTAPCIATPRDWQQVPAVKGDKTVKQVSADATHMYYTHDNGNIRRALADAANASEAQIADIGHGQMGAHWIDAGAPTKLWAVSKNRLGVYTCDKPCDGSSAAQKWKAYAPSRAMSSGSELWDRVKADENNVYVTNDDRHAYVTSSSADSNALTPLHLEDQVSDVATAPRA